MATEKTEIINLTEASGVSANDYVMVDSPTQGVRKVLASNFQGGGGSSVYAETSAPTSDIGSDGDLYFQYKKVSKYIKFSITANRDSEYLQCQFADIRFEDSEGTYFNFSGATATCNQTTSNNEGPAQCIDNNLDTKINILNQSPSVASPDEVTIYIPNGIDFSIYNTWSWWTANDTRQRDPISWKLYVSNDGNTWELLDEQTNYNVPTERKVKAYSKQLGEVSGELVIINKYVKINNEWVSY